MTYIYQTVFDINTADATQVQIGRSLGQSLAYLRSFLPDEPGFISSRAMVSLSHTDKTHLIIESDWEDWASLEEHLNNSPFLEHKILPKFDLQVTPIDLATYIFEEVG